MLIAKEHIGNVGVGITVPQFFRADNNKLYVVKLQNNCLSSKVLVNEFVAAKLGKRMNLCFPPSDIIEINEQTLQNSPHLPTADISMGRHFASEYLENTEYVTKQNLPSAINLAEMAGILLFDHMFHNADRANNRKNLLLRQEDTGNKIYAIDNSHLFRSGRWTLESINTLGIRIKPYDRYCFGILLKDYLYPKDFLPYLDKALQCTNEQMETIVNEIPEEWLPVQAERQALLRHIKLRRDISNKIWKTLCNYIPKTRGGHRWL